jgi:ubiquitin C-terminal hydrolase
VAVQPQHQQSQGAQGAQGHQGPKDQGPKGLRNVGATCYLNSILQSLRFIPEFCDLVEKNKDVSPLLKEAAAVLRELNGSGSVVNPRDTRSVGQPVSPRDTRSVERVGRPVDPRDFVVEFIKAAKSPAILLGYQADAEEALHLLLDSIHETLAVAKSSPISSLFYGETETTFHCGTCRHTATRKESFDILSLEIPRISSSLQDCLAAAYGSKELIEDYTCDGCKSKGTTEKVVRLNQFPSRLIITLKRFTNQARKIKGIIEFDPDLIDLGLAASFSAEGACYRVASTVEHLGSCGSGHYYMRNRGHDGWTVFDDASVHPDGTAGASGPNTYILFLERI